MNGFYVPNSLSSSYVSNKRNEEGSLAYDSAANEIGIQKQAAVQQLEKNYATTIENAYASYLAANRGVDASNMGQGYKELYKTIQQQQLRENIANTNTSFNEAIASLNQQESEAQAQIQSQFQTEVAYFDRLRQSFSDYYNYVKTLTNKAGETYLNTDEMTQSVDSMYDILKNTMPQGYSDKEGNIGMSYEQWIKSQLGNTEEDTTWSQWLFSTGLNEFMEAPKKMRQWQPGELKTIREQEEAKQLEEQQYETNKQSITNLVNTYKDTTQVNSQQFVNELVNIGVPQNNITITSKKGEYDYASGRYLLSYDFNINSKDLSDKTKKLLEEAGFTTSKDSDGNIIYNVSFEEHKAKNINEFFAR